MASSPSSSSRYSVILCFLIFYFESLTADSNSSFSLKNFGKNSNFASLIALYGDAKVVNGGSSVQITNPLDSSVGRVIYRNPIKLYGGTPKKLASFSTYFSFSMSSDSKNGKGLAFVVFPHGYPVDFFDHNGSFRMLTDNKSKFLSVEFDTFMDDVSSFVSVKVMNLSSVNLVLNNGERLQTWIDFEAGSNRLEVRLTKYGSQRPIDPSLFVQLDFSKIWPKEETFFVGFSSSNGNSSQICNVYSWSFKVRETPDWMHSQPLDPMVYKEKEEDEINVHKKSDCVMKIVGALILGIGCGALGTFMGIFLWTIFGNKRQIMPEEYAVKSVDKYEHKKLKIVLDAASNEKQ